MENGLGKITSTVSDMHDLYVGAYAGVGFVTKSIVDRIPRPPALI